MDAQNFEVAGDDAVAGRDQRDDGAGAPRSGGWSSLWKRTVLVRLLPGALCQPDDQQDGPDAGEMQELPPAASADIVQSSASCGQLGKR